MIRGISRLAAVLAMAALPSQPALAQACQADRPVPFDNFIRLATPPMAGARGFSGYPATGFAAQLTAPDRTRFRQFLQPRAASPQDRYVFRWVNRCHDFFGENVRDLGDGSNAPTGAFIAGLSGSRKCRTHRSRGGGPKGNFPEIRISGVRGVPSGNYRFFFSSVARADACTMAQTYANFGADSEAGRLIGDAGMLRIDASAGMPPRLSPAVEARLLPVMAAHASYDPYGGARAGGVPAFDIGAFRNVRGLLDVCLTEHAAGLENRLDGVVFDWEVADDRSLAEGSALARRIDRALRGPNPEWCGGVAHCVPRRAILFTHAWDDPDSNVQIRMNGRTADYVRRSSMAHDGLGPANAADMRRYFDMVSVQISRESRSRNRAAGGDVLLDGEILATLDEQERVLDARSSRDGLIAVIGMGTIDADDATMLRRELDRRGYRNVLIWNYLGHGDRLDSCNGRFNRNLNAFLAG